MDKRYLFVVGTIAVLVVIGLSVFWLFLRSSSPTTEEPLGGAGSFPVSGQGTAGQIMPLQTAPLPTISPGQQKPLTKLTQKAISGATYIEKEQEDKTKIGLIRYFEKATGYIYDIDYQTAKSVRISNTTIPGIFRVYWSQDGKKAIIRYSGKNTASIEDVDRNFSLSINDATTTQGIFFSSKLKGVAVSPKENRIFYFIPFDDSYSGVTASFEDKNQKQILTTPFGDFIAAWPSEKIIALSTKPSFGIEGYLYKLNPTTGSFENIIADVPGLTYLWSPDSELILFNSSGNVGFNNFIYNIKDNKTFSFGLSTLPEKCAWSKLKKGTIYCAVPLFLPAAKYPDDWYQGIISFSDRVWRIDVISGATEIISSETEAEFDFTNLFLDKNENYLFLQNKKDGTLWSLKI